MKLWEIISRNLFVIKMGETDGQRIYGAIDFEYAIEMNEVTFTPGTAIKEDNMCKAVLNKPERV